MQRMLNALRGLIDCFGYLTLGLMCVLIALQVIWRYLLHNALPWPEEMARYSFLATAYCSIAFVCAHKMDGHLRIEVVPLFLGARAKKVLNCVCMVINVCFFAFSTIITYNMLFEIKDMEMNAITVPLPYWWLWVIIVGSMASCTVFSLCTLYQLVTTDNETRAEVQP